MAPTASTRAKKAGKAGNTNKKSTPSKATLKTDLFASPTQSAKAPSVLDIKYELIAGGKLVVFIVTRNGSDGWSKPINDAVRSGELKDSGFHWFDCALRVDRSVNQTKSGSKGYPFRCFPQFVNPETPSTAQSRFKTAKELQSILSRKENNKFNTKYRVHKENDQTSPNEPRAADYVLTDEVIQQVIETIFVDAGIGFFEQSGDEALDWFTPHPVKGDFSDIATTWFGYPDNNDGRANVPHGKVADSDDEVDDP